MVPSFKDHLESDLILNILCIYDSLVYPGELRFLSLLFAIRKCQNRQSRMIFVIL